MPTGDELKALEAQLEPGMRLVVSMLRQTIQRLEATLESLREELKAQRVQNNELRRMLFGRKSEKMPPMEREVRRALDAEELFPPGTSGDPPSEPDSEKKRRERGRKRSEEERKLARAERKRKLPVVRERVVVHAEQLPEGYVLTDFRVVGEGKIVSRVEHVREHLVL